ncbi:MAG: VIT1/CCC1 transporter family protein [bacterium]
MERIDKKLLERIILYERNEITEHYIYEKLSEKTLDHHNKKILYDISREEYKHYESLKDITKRDVSPNRFKIVFYTVLSSIFGITFTLKLMETGENIAQRNYTEVLNAMPNLNEIINDEDRHEKEILSLLDEENLRYISSMILGLSDALVELTGTLAGLTFALRNTALVALSGLITGIAAALSMAASEYLSTKAEEGEKNPVKASIFTGITYIIAVLCLVFPYFLFKNYTISFLFTLLLAILLVIVFNFYISVTKELDFKKRFLEMLFIILIVSIITFGIGILIKLLIGVQV